MPPQEELLGIKKDQTFETGATAEGRDASELTEMALA
jgi:hypothetical protein